MSNYVQPHRRQPTRLHPWDSPGKNTGVGCNFLLQCVKVKSEVAQSCPTLSNPMDCSLPGSSVHGISQARVLEWSTTAFSRWLLDGSYYFLSSLSAHRLTSSGGITDGWDIFCLLMWQEIFHLSDPWHLLTLPMNLVGPCIQCLQDLQGLFSACNPDYQCPFFPSQTERSLLESAFRQLSFTSSGFKPSFIYPEIFTDKRQPRY